jgi:hypothetical protein
MGIITLLLRISGFLLPTSHSEVIEDCSGQKIEVLYIQRNIEATEVAPGKEPKNLLLKHENIGFNFELPMNAEGVDMRTYCDTVLFIGVHNDTFYLAGMNWVGASPNQVHGVFNPKFKVMLPKENPREKSYLYIIPKQNN